MYRVYCIEDINDLKYVGITKQTLAKRMYGHIHKQHINKTCSSNKLILENSIIYELESNISEEDKFEREKYWLNKIDCVNIKKNNYYDNKEEYHKNYMKEYYKKNRQKVRNQQKEYYMSLKS